MQKCSQCSIQFNFNQNLPRRLQCACLICEQCVINVGFKCKKHISQQKNLICQQIQEQERKECEKHKLALEIYCKSHKDIICLKCAAFGEHKQCEYFDIANDQESFITLLNKDLLVIQEKKRQEIEESNQNLIKFQQQLQKIKQDYVQLIELNKTCILDLLERSTKQAHENLNNSIAKVQQQLNQFFSINSHNVELLNVQFSQLEKANILQSSQSLFKQIENIEVQKFSRYKITSKFKIKKSSILNSLLKLSEIQILLKESIKDTDNQDEQLLKQAKQQQNKLQGIETTSPISELELTTNLTPQANQTNLKQQKDKNRSKSDATEVQSIQVNGQILIQQKQKSGAPQQDKVQIQGVIQEENKNNSNQISQISDLKNISQGQNISEKQNIQKNQQNEPQKNSTANIVIQPFVEEVDD